MITLRSLVSDVVGLVSLVLSPPEPNRNGNSYAVTVVTPIMPNEADALRRTLQGFRPGIDSPLAVIPNVQFARWLVIDQLRTNWPHAPRRPSALRSEYLLFSADLTAPAAQAASLPKSFFRDLANHMRDECDEVWGRCRGFPGAGNVERFVDYLVSSQIKIGLYYARFPNLTPDEIARVVGLRDRFAQFVCDHQTEMLLAPGSPRAASAYRQLRDDYLREFPA